jgi:hypothetical protein
MVPSPEFVTESCNLLPFRLDCIVGSLWAEQLSNLRKFAFELRLVSRRLQTI